MFFRLFIRSSFKKQKKYPNIEIIKNREIFTETTQRQLSVKYVKRGACVKRM